MNWITKTHVSFCFEMGQTVQNVKSRGKSECIWKMSWSYWMKSKLSSQLVIFYGAYLHLIPVCFRRDGVHRWLVVSQSRGLHRDKEPCTFTFTYWPNLQSISLDCKSTRRDPRSWSFCEATLLATTPRCCPKLNLVFKITDGNVNDMGEVIRPMVVAFSGMM